MRPEDRDNKLYILEKEFLLIKEALDRFQENVFENKKMLDNCVKLINNLENIYTHSVRKELEQIQSTLSSLNDKQEKINLTVTKWITSFEHYTDYAKTNCKNCSDNNAKNYELITNEIAKANANIVASMDKQLTEMKLSHAKEIDELKAENKALKITVDESDKSLDKIFTTRQVIFAIGSLAVSGIGFYVLVTNNFFK